jgi:hypothetical protein
LRKVDFPCLNEVQNSEKNIALAFLTYPIWFAVSPTPYLYEVLPSLNTSNNNYNDSGLIIILIMD